MRDYPYVTDMLDSNGFRYGSLDELRPGWILVQIDRSKIADFVDWLTTNHGLTRLGDNTQGDEVVRKFTTIFHAYTILGHQYQFRDQDLAILAKLTFGGN